MAESGNVVIIGGTAGIGLLLARHYAGRGRPVVISGRDAGRAKAVAAEVGAAVGGIGVDLSRPHEIAGGLAEVGPVDHLVIAAIERDENSVRDYDIGRALRLATIKLVGYTEVVHALLDRMGEDSSLVLFGGGAKDRPYPGSTTVTTVNGGIERMVGTLALELAPRRVNAVHPGIVGDSPYWRDKVEILDAVRARNPTGRCVTMQDVVHAVVFLLENPSVNAVNLRVDCGTLLL
jgi:NAD(P)-dependent dehydrogenase (short-subunit alcohol dehydrogenase family)